MNKDIPFDHSAESSINIKDGYSNISYLSY